MLTEKTVSQFLNELASNSPAPGGGSVAALAGSTGAALTSMVCNLTIGKKKYAEVDGIMKAALHTSEQLRKTLTLLIDTDTQAFNKVMEAYALPKESENQKALRTAAIQEATKEAALVPLEVMKHVIDVLALTKTVAEHGNVNSISDAGVSALMLNAAAQGAALNVRVNLQSITDTEFVGWRSDELTSILRTSESTTQEILTIVRSKITE